MRQSQKKYILIFTEIVAVIFIIIAILCLFWFKTVDVRSEGQAIYNWKTKVKLAEYSYNVVLMTESNALKNLIQLPLDERNVQILNLFFEPLGKKADRVFDNYKYRYLNARRVEKNDLYYVRDFAYAIDKKSIFGINWTNSDCFETKGKCGIMVFDMNGLKGPNRFGVDVFGVNVYSDRLEPFGTGLGYNELEKHCNRLELGVTCSKLYLVGGQFFK